MFSLSMTSINLSWWIVIFKCRLVSYDILILFENIKVYYCIAAWLEVTARNKFYKLF